jgi:CRP-like cAMP-binding protein
MGLFSFAMVYVRASLLRRLEAPVRSLSGQARDDRDLLVGSASVLWQTVQLRLATFAGKSAAESARTHAAAETGSLKVGREELNLREGSAVDLVSLGDEVAAVFEKAARVWLAFAGPRVILNAAEAGYQKLTWRERLLLADYAFRGGDVWASLTPKPGDRQMIDPERELRRLSLFRDLPEEKLQLAVSRVHLEQYKAGEDIVVEGEVGDRMYVIHSGTAEVLARDVTGALRPKVRLRAGDYFGQVAILRDCKRTATVRANADVWLFSLSRNDVRDLWPETKQRAHSEDFVTKINRLHDVPLLRRLPLPELELFAETSVFRSFGTGETIINEGEPGHDFYVIDQGEVRVTQEGRELRRLGPGEFFGEIALLFKIPRTASVAATRDCRCLVLPGEVFRQFAARQDALRNALTEVGESRLATA